MIGSSGLLAQLLAPQRSATQRLPLLSPATVLVEPIWRPSGNLKKLSCRVNSGEDSVICCANTVEAHSVIAVHNKAVRNAIFMSVSPRSAGLFRRRTGETLADAGGGTSKRAAGIVAAGPSL